MSAIVLVDDDAQFRELIGSALADRGHLVIGVADAESALYELAQHAVDAALVDVRLPGMDGVAFVREVRRRGNIPLIVLTGCSDSGEEAAVLNAGGDAFLVKPVSVDELDLRVRMLVRRSQTPAPDKIQVGDVIVHPAALQVEVRGSVVQLTRVETRLLVELITAPLLVHSRSQLRERIFGTEPWAATAALERHIRRLRTVIEPEPNRPRHLVAVRGMGYRFVP